MQHNILLALSLNIIFLTKIKTKTQLLQSFIKLKLKRSADVYVDQIKYYKTYYDDKRKRLKLDKFS